MDFAVNYVLRMVSGGILCALVLSVTGSSGAGGRILKMLCGLVMALLAISPLRELDTDSIRFTDPAITAQAEQAVQAGTEQAQQAMASIIKEQSASYILTKAAELSLELTVEIELEPDSMIPRAVTLSGSATPYEKETLSDYITQNLGIERSSIQWNH